MHRPIAAVALTFALASLAGAQAPGSYSQPRTAMGALGQTGVLRGTAPAGYRLAARNGVGAPGAGLSGGVAKPFNYTTAGPTITPYLNLFRDEDQRAAPNYYTFVRPLQEQAAANRAQQMQFQQLQRQIQQTASPAGSVSRGSVAGGARYGDTSHYYQGWRR